MPSDSPQALSNRAVIKLVVAVMLLQVFVLFIESWLRIELMSDGMAEAIAADVSKLVAIPLLAILLYPVVRDFLPQLKSKLRWCQLNPGTILLGIGLGFSLRMVSWSELIAGVSFGFFVNPDPDAIAGPTVQFGCPPLLVMSLSLLAMALFAPVAEEIVNRAFLLQWFVKYGEMPAIIGSAMLFAILHRPDSMLFAFMFGIFSGALYLNSGTLWGPLIAHMTVNGMIVFDWDCINTQWNPPAVSDITRGIGLLAVCLGIVSFALACLIVSKRIAGPPAR